MAEGALSELLKALRGQLEFVAVMEDAVKQRPVVPAYHPCLTADEEYRLVATLRTQSARREGFDLLFFALTGKRLDERSTTKGDSNA